MVSLRVVNRILNLHNGPLPRYRGASPLNLGTPERETIARRYHTAVTAPACDSGTYCGQLQLTSIYRDVDESRCPMTHPLNTVGYFFQHTMPIL